MTLLDLPQDEPHVIKPAVDVLGDGFVNISWPEDKLTAHLEGLWRSGSRFETVLRIRHDDLGTVHAPTRINLLSTSARTDLRRSLDSRFSHIGWATRIDQIADYADKVYRSELQITTIGEAEPPAMSYLASPVLERNRICALAAEAGTGKSTLALALALQIGGHGQVVPGISVPQEAGKTLYLDWEDEWDTHANRQAAILRGVGKKAPPLPVRHVRMSGLLVDHSDRLTRMCRDMKPALVVVDSVGKAVMGHINEPEFVLPMMDACRAMKTTVLMLGHLAKHESDGKLIGSVFWFTDPRQGWHLAKVQEAGESESHLALNHKKASNDMLSKPLGLKVEFQADPKTIRYYAADVATDPDLEQFAVAADRIENYLVTGGGREQLGQIAEGTGLPVNTVKGTLQRFKGKKFIVFGRGRGAEWAALRQLDTLDTSNKTHVSNSNRIQNKTQGGPPLLDKGGGPWKRESERKTTIRTHVSDSAIEDMFDVLEEGR